MKKLMILLIIWMLLSTTVLAGYVEDFYGITWRHEEKEKVNMLEERCEGALLFAGRINQLNDVPLFIEALEAFDEGYHVFHLRQYELDGANFYTMEIKNGKLHSLRKGLCISGEEYTYYYTDLTPERIERMVEAENPMEIMNKVMTEIKGLSLYQKYHIIKTGIKAAVQLGLEGLNEKV